MLTEKGFVGSGLDEILQNAGVPKGSFYHYFPNKEAFGNVLIEEYIDYFEKKLQRILHSNESTAVAPLERIRRFTREAAKGMAKYQFSRGCLIGNLEQEVSYAPSSFRQMLQKGFERWEHSLSTCLSEAQIRGDIRAELDCAKISRIFWIGWEGAVSRARLEQSDTALKDFGEFFLASIT